MSNTKTEVKLWLEKALAKENLKNISVEIQGNSEKGDGYMGDIVFVNATATDITTNQEKNLDLVLKCSKKSQVLRDTTPVKDAFYNEITMYSEILPAFQKFQKSKSVENVFNNFPKYYGHFTNEATEIIVLKNIKKNGFELWDNSKTLTTKHLKIVLEKYGVYHAISAAMKVQKPEEFYEHSEKLVNFMQKFSETQDIEKMMGPSVFDAYDLLKNCCSEDVLEKLLKFHGQLNYIFHDMLDDAKDAFNVISHGDCWNNNFMWRHNEQNKTVPEEVVILDWQLSSLISPIIDLSYFLFSCISQEDLNNFNEILDTYYNSFSQTLKQLGNNAEDLYPKKQLLFDWQRFARYGFAMSLQLVKLGFTKKEDLPDIAKSAEEGKDMIDTFKINISDSEGYKQRIKPLVEFAVKNNLID